MALCPKGKRGGAPGVGWGVAAHAVAKNMEAPTADASGAAGVSGEGPAEGETGVLTEVEAPPPGPGAPAAVRLFVPKIPRVARLDKDTGTASAT